MRLRISTCYVNRFTRDKEAHIHKLNFFLRSVTYHLYVSKNLSKKLAKNYPFFEINSQCRETESLKRKFTTVLPVSLHSSRRASCFPENCWRLRYSSKIYLRWKNSLVRFLRSMDSKAKKAGGKSGNLTLTAGSWVITGLGYGKTEKFFESLVALLNFALPENYMKIYKRIKLSSFALIWLPTNEATLFQFRGTVNNVHRRYSGQKVWYLRS